MATPHNAYFKALGLTRFKLRHVEEVTIIEPAATPAPAPKATHTINWDALKANVANCTACPLHETRTQTVFGVGNTSADLLIVGEAPGFHEDKQGEPFVGRAGQLLTAMLRAIDLSRHDVYIANVLKCRPPQNRDPSPEEVKQCTTFLDQQINAIQPRLIMAVGRVAAHYLLGSTAPMEQMRNKQHTYGNTPLIVTYHPAYLLRSPADKRKAWEDLKRVREMLRVG